MGNLIFLRFRIGPLGEVVVNLEQIRSNMFWVQKFESQNKQVFFNKSVRNNNITTFITSCDFPK